MSASLLSTTQTSMSSPKSIQSEGHASIPFKSDFTGLSVHLPRLARPALKRSKNRSRKGLAQQRYVKSHRILANCRGVKDFRRFRNSQDGPGLVGQFWGLDSDRILKLVLQEIILSQEIQMPPRRPPTHGHRLQQFLPSGRDHRSRRVSATDKGNSSRWPALRSHCTRSAIRC